MSEFHSLKEKKYMLNFKFSLKEKNRHCFFFFQLKSSKAKAQRLDFHQKLHGGFVLCSQYFSQQHKREPRESNFRISPVALSRAKYP